MIDPIHLIPQATYDNYEKLTENGQPQLVIDYLTAVMEYTMSHKKYQGHNKTLLRLLIVDYFDINEKEALYGVTDLVSKI